MGEATFSELSLPVSSSFYSEKKPFQSGTPVEPSCYSLEIRSSSRYSLEEVVDQNSYSLDDELLKINIFTEKVTFLRQVLQDSIKFFRIAAFPTKLLLQKRYFSEQLLFQKYYFLKIVIFSEKQYSGTAIS